MRTNFNPNKGKHNLDNLCKQVHLFGSLSEKDEPWDRNSPTQQNKSASPSKHALIFDINAMHLNETNSLKPAKNLI